MEISEELKKKIEEESNTYLTEIKETSEYGDLTKEERDELGAFFTPPVLVCQMLEMFDETVETFSYKTILDPTCGSGNLIMGALIVGSSSNKHYYKNVFGNELSEKTLGICRKRFKNWCEKNLKDVEEDWENIWSWHIHQGDALQESCICEESFVKEYEFKNGKGKYPKKFSLNRGSRN